MPVAPSLRNMPELMTVDQVRRVLQVNANWVYAKIRKGKIPAVRFSSKCIRVRRDDLAKIAGFNLAEKATTGCSDNASQPAQEA